MLGWQNNQQPRPTKVLSSYNLATKNISSDSLLHNDTSLSVLNIEDGRRIKIYI
jgi:hypothetical protein